MSFPRLRQGGYRKKPDGYLHLNNFSHSTLSGMAGALYERVFSNQQRNTFEELLKEVAIEVSKDSSETLFIHKHGCIRFKKTFLREHFQKTLYGYLNLVRKSGAALASLEVTMEFMRLTQSGEGIPKLRFK